MAEEKSLQESSENRHRGCGCDVLLRQTVPGASAERRQQEWPGKGSSESSVHTRPHHCQQI